jgi:hypothetical protein
VVASHVIDYLGLELNILFGARYWGKMDRREEIGEEGFGFLFDKKDRRDFFHPFTYIIFNASN